MLKFAHDNAKIINVLLLCASAVLGVLVQQGMVPPSLLPVATALLGAGGVNVTKPQG